MIARLLRLRLLPLLASALLPWASSAAESAPSPLDAVAAQSVADFTAQIATATHELETTRQRIAGEKAPANTRLQELEKAIVSLQAEVAALEESRARAGERSQQLQKDSQLLTRNTAYLQNLAHDLLRVVEVGLAPGEDDTALATLRQDLDRHAADADIALRAFLLAKDRIDLQLGGHTIEGKAIEPSTNRIATGTFGYLGPQTVFVATDGSFVGPVSTREGSPYPIVHPLPEWPTRQAAPLASGGEATVLLDPTNGKALSLRRTTGTTWDHIRRGGFMAFVIIGTGTAALLLALHKIWELRSLKLDPPAAVRSALTSLGSGSLEQATAGAHRLTGVTHGLFLTAVQHFAESKSLIEEQLFAFTMGQRLRYEKRLPFLAVIATAAPLMGLLGTVMGMVKTFALITVFGTGNAAKLSSGISEILVTTELGLAVAIPALVAHGFLTHRVQKQLSQLERHAVEILAAISGARDRAPTVGQPSA